MGSTINEGEYRANDPDGPCSKSLGTVAVDNSQVHVEGAAFTNEGGSSGSEICSSFAGCIAAVVYVFTVGLGSAAALIAAYFFNYTVYLSLNSTAYALQFLTDGWISVRDIANMGFIFILIYIAVTIIIRAETNRTMEMLVRVIAIALIINFSFFFVRIVIDMGNVVAINFYNKILTAVPTIAETTTGSGSTHLTQMRLATTALMGLYAFWFLRRCCRLNATDNESSGRT
jgi:hypothetical protein